LFDPLAPSELEMQENSSAHLGKTMIIDIEKAQYIYQVNNKVIKADNLFTSISEAIILNYLYQP
jgi:hypothetical protein